MSPFFKAGRIAKFIQEWKKLTTDPFILDIVKNCHIDLDTCKEIKSNCVQYKFEFFEETIIDKEIEKLLEIEVLVKVEPEQGQILSPIFFREKSNNEYRLVINLKKVNECIPYKHFEMETFEKTLTLVTEALWFLLICVMPITQ